MSFVGTLKGGLPGRERAMEVIMGLLNIFGAVPTVLITGDGWLPKDEERRGIIESCREKTKKL